MADETNTQFYWDGTVLLTNGKERKITPMYDLFMNYAHKDNTGADILANAVNIFLEDLNSEEEYMPFIDSENAQVIDQYIYLLHMDAKRKQDFRLTDKKHVYIELQNRTKGVVPPVVTRAVTYFGLGIEKGETEENKEKGTTRKDAYQIWFLADHLDEVLHGLCFEVYSLRSEINGQAYPLNSKILFVDLKRIAKEKTGKIAELAKFLLGQQIEPKSPEVMKIIEFYKKKFRAFKREQEVKDKMTLLEEERLEGRLEGIDEGILVGLLAGEIKVYYVTLGWEVAKIAKELNLTEEEVSAIIQGNNW
ncbi:MAG: hypothetical protein FWG68_03960 [Defluviitaleaceae bacterium]|nr:hypothetical protein [Defluviitaleaceae bacterium]